MAVSKEILRRLLIAVKGENEKDGLKINIQKTKRVASGPTFHGNKKVRRVQTMADFMFLGSKITADSDCSHEI